jgi:hypothetical protein
MPLIRPEIQNMLRKAGLGPEVKTPGSEGSLSEKLDAAGLSLEETLEHLAFIAKESGNETLRFNCLKAVAQMHGALKETAPAPPSFTIVIQGDQLSHLPSSVPDGIPQGINPILLPRQLLKELVPSPTEKSHVN